jgi:hypothetical protein
MNAYKQGQSVIVRQVISLSPANTVKMNTPLLSRQELSC